jgi:glycosyltransferase involved in cell wall biosynthesis
VIMPTFNRASTIKQSIQSVLEQDYADFELLVIDDGSTDNTEEVISSIGDSRVKYIKRSNGGISVARNTGIFQGVGEWMTFLDDDDQVSPDWLSTFNNMLLNSSVGVACIGATVYQDNRGPVTVMPRQLNAVYEDVRGLFWAGTFAARSFLLKKMGGFADAITCSHATELALRLIPACHQEGLAIESTNKALLRINRTDAYARRMRSPSCLLKGTTYLLEKHGEIIRRSPASLSRYLMIAGVAAARLGSHQESRKFFLRAFVAQPWNLKSFLRLMISLNSSVAEYVWRARQFSPESISDSTVS